VDLDSEDDAPRAIEVQIPTRKHRPRGVVVISDDEEDEQAHPSPALKQATGRRAKSCKMTNVATTSDVDEHDQQSEAELARLEVRERGQCHSCSS
jgi:hypothetical protein